jgi:hypothetical protein
VILVPPLTVTATEIEQIVGALRGSLAEVADE